jgi:hypothetical protein
VARRKAKVVVEVKTSIRGKIVVLAHLVKGAHCAVNWVTIKMTASQAARFLLCLVAGVLRQMHTSQISVPRHRHECLLYGLLQVMLQATYSWIVARLSTHCVRPVLLVHQSGCMSLRLNASLVTVQ